MATILDALLGFECGYHLVMVSIQVSPIVIQLGLLLLKHDVVGQMLYSQLLASIQ